MIKAPDTLSILQYNVMRSRDQVMISLMEDSQLTAYDIVAIQEPWRNPFTNTTYNGNRDTFELAYQDSDVTRACFFVNKRMDPGTWKVTYHSPDSVTISIKIVKDRSATTLNIHNIYNPPSPHLLPSEETQTEMNHGNIMLEGIVTMLQMEGEHILLGDFNLHHQAWGGYTETRQHAIADLLLDITTQFNVPLVLPVGTITRARQGHRSSTLDLVFASSSLEAHILKCEVRKGLDHDSDHYPIETVLGIGSNPATPRKMRAWKKLNDKTFRATLKANLHNDMNLDSPQLIDSAMDNLTQALQSAIELSTPWLKVSPHSKSYWTERCTEAVKAARRARRHHTRDSTEESKLEYQRCLTHKKKTLRRHKSEEHRKRVTEVASQPDGIWKLAKWAKDRSTRQANRNRIPSLASDRGMMTEIKDKIQVLGESFFPNPPEPDMTDTMGYVYDTRVGPYPEISSTEITTAIQNTAPNKAPGLDGIPNHIIQ